MKYIDSVRLSLAITFSFFSLSSIVSANTIFFKDPTPQNIKKGTFINHTNPHKKIELMIWLKLKNENKMLENLREIYNPESKLYHHFLTKTQFNAEYTQTEESLNKIKKYFIQQGLKIISVAKNHLFIRVSGEVSQIERVFSIKINDYRYDGKIIFANAQAPTINNEIGATVQFVTGLNDLPPIDTKCNSSITQPTGSTFNPLYGLNTSLTAELKDSQGKILLPNMTFTGFIPGGANGNGYTPAQIQSAYDLAEVFNRGYKGENQTVVIIDTCLSPSLQADVNAFTSANNLPPLTIGSNLIITNYGSVSTCGYGSSDVAMREETLDVEGYHTTAPNANINLALGSDVLTTLASAIADGQSGYVFSVSHSTPEMNVPTNIESSLRMAAMTGMSVNVSSGDCGDNTTYSAANNQLSVNYPSSSPWVTAVGATALFLDNDNHLLAETGWGTALNISYTCNNLTGPTCTSYTANFSNQGSNPQGFVEGTTGGISALYPAQPWQQNAISNVYAGGYGLISNYVQSNNPLTLYRAVPDISMYGERFFPGFEIYITNDPNPGPTPNPVPYSGAGTSLACPLFSGLVTLANQERAAQSKSPLGLVSSYLYNLPEGAVRKVDNPHGIGNPISGSPNPNAFQLFQVNPANGNLYGVVYNYDSSLTVGGIWNDVTGVGSPYAPLFVKALVSN